DHRPVRDAQEVVGHSVRQLYLLAGVADLAAETGEADLRDAAIRLWAEGTARKTYLTGGVGAHHRDEAYGDPYELPNERSYCETCAAIASIMFSWRMLILTGESRYADLLERTLYNGFLAGISLDGERYIYANPLQVRDGHLAAGSDQDYARKPWFACACCPPNVMRLIASLEHYVALGAPDGLVLHQFVPGGYAAELPSGRVGVRVATEYPWRGEVDVTVAETIDSAWTLTVRVPDWAAGATLAVDGVPVERSAEDGWWRVSRRWQLGDRLTLSLPLTPRLSSADPRVDADRGCLAVERGPLVYCVESADQPGTSLDDIVFDPADVDQIAETAADGLPGDVVALRVPVTVRAGGPSSWWPYGVAAARSGTEGEPTELTAIPYYAWGNRSGGAMRIWLPTT
ncbi:MAG TPA: beta-L-arabinofuranosidase domain-containing protein, partial [Microlunatus sp.]|nr:beta-L-arabinofuranosidase domain-containing protein [Microlunatus sp.]